MTVIEMMPLVDASDNGLSGPESLAAFWTDPLSAPIPDGHHTSGDGRLRTDTDGTEVSYSTATQAPIEAVGSSQRAAESSTDTRTNTRVDSPASLFPLPDATAILGDATLRREQAPVLSRRERFKLGMRKVIGSIAVLGMFAGGALGLADSHERAKDNRATVAANTARMATSIGKLGLSFSDPQEAVGRVQAPQAVTEAVAATHYTLGPEIPTVSNLALLALKDRGEPVDPARIKAAAQEIHDANATVLGTQSGIDVYQDPAMTHLGQVDLNVPSGL